MSLIIPFKSVNLYRVANYDFVISIITLFTIIFNLKFKINKNHLKILFLILSIGIPVKFLSLFLINIGILPVFSYILQLIHIMGLIFCLEVLGSRFIEFSKENDLDYGIVIITTIFILGSLLFFLVEKPINPNVNNYEDAIWYSIVTITTTGYGDIVPVSSFGRFIGSLLMISGVSFLSFAIASITGTFLKKFKEEKSHLTKTIQDLDEKLEKIKKN